jgi:hypothetical protein
MKSTTRRAAAVTAATVAAVASSVVIAGPASADVPQGWETSHMDGLHLLVFILFIPLAVAIVIALLVLLPGVLRGERLIPTEHAREQAPESRTPARVEHH